VSAGRLVLLGSCALLLTAGDCDRNVTDDPLFHDWCGESLCSWQVTGGEVKRVPTWDSRDFGISFLDGASIAQRTSEQEAQCLLFTSVGDLEPSAGMTIGADFNNDGTLDFSAPLGSARWSTVQIEIAAPRAYRGITFHVTKGGSGTATLAQLRVQAPSACAGAAPLELSDLPMGDACGESTECAAGLQCAGKPDGGLYGLCSECADTCAGGAICRQRNFWMPFQCGPGEGRGASGAKCLNGSDCQSGTCVGARPIPLGDDDAGACDLQTLEGCQWFGALAGACQ